MHAQLYQIKLTNILINFLQIKSSFIHFPSRNIGNYGDKYSLQIKVYVTLKKHTQHQGTLNFQTVVDFRSSHWYAARRT